MYSATQLQYLQAMGIPAWQSRQAVALPVQAAPVAKVSAAVAQTSAPDESTPRVVQAPPAVEPGLGDWLNLQPLQMTAPGQPALWGSSDSGLLVLSECLPDSETGAPVTQPFYGPHGKMLDAMLKGINLSRRGCKIAALGDPASAVVAGLPLGELLEQLQPRLILFFCFPGGCDAKVDFNDNLQRGLLQVGPCPCVTSYHPFFLLNNPECKRVAWEDLKRVRQLLGTG